MVEVVLGIVIAGALLATGPPVRRAVRDFAFTIGGRQGLDGLEVAGRALMGVALGVVGTSLLQAVLAAIGYALAGLPAAPFVAFVIFVSALLQIGPLVVSVPLVGWLVWQDETGEGGLRGDLVVRRRPGRGRDREADDHGAHGAALRRSSCSSASWADCSPGASRACSSAPPSLAVAWTLLQTWLAGSPAPEDGPAHSPGGGLAEWTRLRLTSRAMKIAG